MNEVKRQRGRVQDPATGRWYKDGFAPFQLPKVIVGGCLRCGGEQSLLITSAGAFCLACSADEELAGIRAVAHRL